MSMPETPPSSQGANVASLRGDVRPNADLVAHLQGLVEQAESGDLIGIVCVKMHSDMTASQMMAGKVGGAPMIGQLGIMDHELKVMTVVQR